MAESEPLQIGVDTLPMIGENLATESAFVSSDRPEPGGSCLGVEKGNEMEGGEGGSSRLQRSYSRAEMEALRFSGVEEQRRRWDEVRERMDEVAAREYDGLRQTNAKKNKCGSKKKKKKEEMALVVGEGFAVNTTKSLDSLDLSDLASCNLDIVGKDNLAKDVSCDYGSMDIKNNITNADSEQPFEKPFCDNGSMKNHDNLGNEKHVEYEEYVSSDDEPCIIQRPAFLVEGEPDFDSGPPLDGLEYLRRVRWEATHIPNVKVAKLSSMKQMTEQTPYMPKLPEIPECPSHLLPSRDWEDDFLVNFHDIREAFTMMVSSSDAPSVSGHQEKPFIGLICRDKPLSMPTMSLIHGMDAVYRAAALRHYISMFEGETVLSRDYGLWLFTLCAVVDTPLDGDTCASLRCLLRKCSSILSGKSEPDDEVAMLSILIAITGKYFGQSERK